MQPGKSIASLKRILNSIHQPLPLNQKESQRLLESLTSSFRKHLDEEHGFVPEDKHARETSTPNTAPSRLVRSKRPTDRHLHSILSNPLFSYENSSATATSGSNGDVTKSEPVAQLGRDPMDVFEEAVAKGMMNPLRAAGCLKAKRLEIVQSVTLSIPEGMASSGAGRRVALWLRASGLERDLSFLAHKPLLQELIPFLVAEGLEEVVWSWLTRVMEAGSAEATIPDSGLNRRAQAKSILLLLVESKASSAASLDDAYAGLLRAQEILASSSTRKQMMVLPAWHNLNWRSTVQAWQHPSKPSTRLFDNFSEVGHRYLHASRPVNRVELAHLALHHPTAPDHEPATRELFHPAIWSELSSLQSTSAGAPVGFKLRLRSIGLDLVTYFAQRGMADQAQQLIRILEDKLGHYFVTTPPGTRRLVQGAPPG